MLDVLWSVAAFAVAIGVLISFHEYGHFFVARALGVKVLRYSIGFGRTLWRRVGADGVEYVIAAVPLGGYVKMLDEREGEVAPADLPRAFNRQKTWKRILIVAAGPAANLLLAIVAFWVIFVSGVSDLKPIIGEPRARSVAANSGLHRGDEILALDGEAIDSFQGLRTELIERALNGETVQLQVRDATGASRPVELALGAVRVDPEYLFDDLGLRPFKPQGPLVVAEVVPGAPADRAGFKADDRILSQDGAAFTDVDTWRDWIEARPGQLVNFEVQRGSDRVKLSAILAARERDGQPRGYLGAGIHVDVPRELWDNLSAEHRLSVLAAAPAAVAETGRMCALTLKMLYRMVLGDVSVKNISGPIQIAQVAGITASSGLVSFLNFIAIMSVSLAVLNLLPVPVLDGGHLLFYLVESIKGSPLSERAQAIGQQVGLTVLIALMGLAFYNDILRLIHN